MQIDALQQLDTLVVRTRNSTYEVTVVSPRTGDVLVRGGRFFPEPTRARVGGSSLGSSFLKLRGIYVGFCLEFYYDDRQWIVTSPVQSIAAGPHPGVH